MEESDDIYRVEQKRIEANVDKISQGWCNAWIFQLPRTISSRNDLIYDLKREAHDKNWWPFQ